MRGGGRFEVATKVIKARARRMAAPGLRACTVLAEDPHLFPGSMPGSFQPPVTPVPGDQAPSSGLQGHLHSLHKPQHSLSGIYIIQIK